jgi:pimeloyl-[acyl-carrier protein] synthase
VNVTAAARPETFDEEYVRFVNEAWADPRPFLERLRAAHPVYRTPYGYWFVTSFEHGERIYKDNVGWSRRPVVLSEPHPLVSKPGPTAAFFGENLLALDGGEHLRMRSVLNRVLTPVGVRQLRGTIEGTVNALLDAVEERGEMEFVEEFSRPLPTRVILDIFALDYDEYGRFLEVAHTIMECFESLGTSEAADDLIERADTVIGSCAEYMRQIAEERRGSGAPDLLSQLVRAREEESDRLSESEFSTMIMHLVAAGFETTAGTAANVLLTLLRHPDQLDLLRADPSLCASAVEEVLRYEPGVVVSAPMYALEDQEIAGEHIRRGDQLLISNYGANHDPAVFDEPLRFDVTREPNRQLSFGRGRHVCVGASLARTELQLMLEAIVTRLPNIELVTREPQWKDSHVLRAFEALHVRW